MNIFYAIGSLVLVFFSSLRSFGEFVIFQIKLMPKYFLMPRFGDIIKQVYTIGVGTTGVVALTAFFTGMVFAIQLYSGFHKFGVDSFMGYTIFIAISKELGPVFGSLMLISRAVSSMAAELGTMRVTEQIDAIETLALDSKRVLIIPRVVAATISLPILVVVFDFVGNLSAFWVATYILDINPTTYQNIIMQNLEYSDIYSGLIKAVIFGFMVSSIGTYMGYITKGGARGVGIATTKAVVFAAVTVFGADYLISSFFMTLGW
jgi:phospholipid/cholesterol/gamma-HCH transport system permease protein